MANDGPFPLRLSKRTHIRAIHQIRIFGTDQPWGIPHKHKQSLLPITYRVAGSAFLSIWLFVRCYFQVCFISQFFSLSKRRHKICLIY